jgi:hypothetical protein
MPWYPGQVAVGQKVEASVFGMARGFWSQPPVVVQPGTAASGSATVNSTGFDCMVYPSATTTLTKIVVNSSGTIAGASLGTAGAFGPPVYLPAGQTIAITYTGTLTWFWQAV